MKKKFPIVQMLAAMLLAMTVPTYSNDLPIGQTAHRPNIPSKATKTTPTLPPKEIKIVDADKVAQSPEEFKDYIGIAGSILKIDESKTLFILTCGDGCIKVPVMYKGEIPKVGSKVVVYGKIQKTEGKGYIFNADKVESK